ncbi:Anaerobic selenocysteine-containing dehydrogenase [Solimonas aquatica]|uniref:Anaerobic selenocysteine-containing dehydrogenase n=1 Tax=Solimonas aquatica TaxID=489703 RepID=A0A1H9FJM8_9GAMM|nr:molybdopterin-dependent oxidoreductase [Solimonas aquatica]SEQ38170.1 Anaerobic selenocysteine-containing dehydrogenase [Solimonas aquatica]
MPGSPSIMPSAVGSRSLPRAHPRPGVETRKALCASCDIACSVVTEVQKGRVTRVRSSDNPLFKDNICVKGITAPKNFANPERVLYPQRRVGERGSGQWQRVSWEEAMADIGARLKTIIAQHGPEAWAVSTSQWNTGTDHGLGRRIMNHIGSPNWISGVALCAGNTAAVNRLTYGWFPWPDYDNTHCIVLFGHNPGRNSWVPIYNQIQRVKARGGKLIVLDPRKSECAAMADLWLPLKVGTDTAMMMGWLKVILDERLYDEDFVARWTIGFEDLRRRVDEFPLSRVAQITGVSAELIAKAARLYASQGPSVIPWTPITDQQRNSTSGIRLHSILRAVCGYLDVPGGEALMGFHPDIVPESAVEMHEVLPEAQKAKQLGADQHPVFTYRGQAALREPLRRVWGHEYANQATGCYMANPSAVFRAMAGQGPYPVKALFSIGNNTLLGFANMPLILKALLNQELIVVQEHVMTPTAQLADYVLPGDSWLERPWMFDGYGWLSLYKPSQKSMEPPGECKSTFEFWKLVAGALDRPELVPWPTLEAFYDWRLKGLGVAFETFASVYEVHADKLEFRKYEKTGFATPSGKVELRSSILESLGFDPLPYWREDPPPDPEYPLMMFTGVREAEYFQTGGRHVPELRARKPEPQLFISPATARAQELQEGQWVVVETRTGRVDIQVSIRDTMPDNLVRIPHGWWKPETAQGLGTLSGALQYADAQLCGDEGDYLDHEQGIPHLKGLPCRIVKKPEALA